MNLGERVKKVRKELDLTQQEFADRLRMKRNSIAQIETGRNTSDQTVFSICREFNVSEEWLRTGNGEMFIQMSKDEEIAAFIGKALSTETVTFKKRFISALSRLSDSDWEAMERFIEEMKKD